MNCIANNKAPVLDLSFIRGVAAKIRGNFEQGNVPVEHIKKLYAQYSPELEDLGTFFEEAKGLFPNLNCGIASVYLRDVLGQGEITQGTYGEHTHTFLLLNDNYVIDITADQYGGPKIYVGKIKLPWKISK